MRIFPAVTSHIFLFKTFLNAISSQLINRSRVACLLKISVTLLQKCLQSSAMLQCVSLFAKAKSVPSLTSPHFLYALEALMTVCLPFLLTLFKPDSCTHDLGVVILNEVSSTAKSLLISPSPYVQHFQAAPVPRMDNWRNIL